MIHKGGFNVSLCTQAEFDGWHTRPTEHRSAPRPQNAAAVAHLSARLSGESDTRQGCWDVFVVEGSAVFGCEGWPFGWTGCRFLNSHALILTDLPRGGSRVSMETLIKFISDFDLLAEAEIHTFSVHKSSAWVSRLKPLHHPLLVGCSTHLSPAFQHCFS